jgi:hypothetical protein
MERVLVEKLIGFQLVKEFPAFYGIRRFITAFTSARHRIHIRKDKIFVLMFTGYLNEVPKFIVTVATRAVSWHQKKKVDLITADRRSKASVLTSVTRYLSFLLKHHVGDGITCPLSLCLCVTALVEALEWVVPAFL